MPRRTKNWWAQLDSEQRAFLRRYESHWAVYERLVRDYGNRNRGPCRICGMGTTNYVTCAFCTTDYEAILSMANKGVRQ